MRKLTVLILFPVMCTAPLLYTRPSTGRPPAQILCPRHFEIPQYDPLARQARIEGDVQLTLDIGANGTVEKIRDIVGHPLLAEPVVKAAKQWTFFPQSSESSELRITFRFSLAGMDSQELKSYSISGDFPELVKITTNPPQKSFPN